MRHGAKTSIACKMYRTLSPDLCVMHHNVAITQIPALVTSHRTRRNDVQSSTTPAAVSYLLQHIGQRQAVRSLRSWNSVLLTKTTTAVRAFCISAPTVCWDSLPSTVRKTLSQVHNLNFCADWRDVFSTRLRLTMAIPGASAESLSLP